MNLDINTLKSSTLNAVNLQFSKGSDFFLVVLHKSNLLTVLSAPSSSSVGNAKSFQCSIPSFVAWKLFSRKDAVAEFIAGLKVIDDIMINDNGTHTNTEAEKK